jgi:branched-chain amino acid transport system permease protein
METDLTKIKTGLLKRNIGFAAMGIILLIAPALMPNNYWLRIYTMTGLWVMLSLGLNIVAGFAGLFDLAYVAFF